MKKNKIPPRIAFWIQAVSIGRQAHNGGNGLGIKEEESPTLTKTDKHAVMHTIYDDAQITSPQNGSNPKPGDPSTPLTKSGRVPLLVEETCVLPENINLLLQGIIHIFTEKIYYGSENKRNAIKALCLLLKKTGEEKVAEWGIGGINTFQQTKILWDALYGERARRTEEGNTQALRSTLAGQKGKEERQMRTMWVETEFGHSPQGRKLEQQLIRKFTGFMQIVPLYNTQEGQEMCHLWESAEGSWLLRHALSAFQKIWRPANNKSKPTQQVLIRRLTPKETLRLQGFPDDYLINVPGYSDSKAYSAVGNSMTVQVMHWIGKRIDLVDRTMKELKATQSKDNR